MQDIKLPTRLKEEYSALASKYKDLYIIEVKTPGKNYFGFFKKPTFTEFRQIYAFLSKGDDLIADKLLLEKTYVGGDEEIIDVENNLEVFLSVKEKLGGIISIYESTLKKK